MDMRTCEGEKSVGGARRYGMEVEGSLVSISSSSAVEILDEEMELLRSEWSCAVGISLSFISP